MTLPSTLRALIAAAVLWGLLLAAIPMVVQAAESEPATKPAARTAKQPTKSARKPTSQTKSTSQAKKSRNAAAPGAPAQPAVRPQPADSQDTATCTVEGATETGPVTYTVPIPVPGSKQHVAQCLMPPKQAIALLKKGSLLLVDTRREAEFERYRIPGSLNIPLAFVKTKTFLRDRRFALINEGHSSATLEASCEALRSAGFKDAAVLRGGLFAWKSAGGTLDGDLLAQRQLNRITPADFAEQGGYADWLAMSVARVAPGELEKFMPKAVALSSARDDSNFAAALKAALAKRVRKGSVVSVVVVDDDGSRIDKLESLLPAGVGQPVLFLDGGLAGYRRFWSEQAAIWAAVDRGPRRPRCGA